jgi:hypothetical protein
VLGAVLDGNGLKHRQESTRIKQGIPAMRVSIMMPPLGLSVSVVHLGQDPLYAHTHNCGGHQHDNDNLQRSAQDIRSKTLPFHRSAPFRT